MRKTQFTVAVGLQAHDQKLNQHIIIVLSNLMMWDVGLWDVGDKRSLLITVERAPKKPKKPGATDISDGLPKVLKEMQTLISRQQQNNGVNNNNFSPPASVFGSRAHLEKESTASRSKVRTILMHAFHFFVATLCSPRIKDTQCGFKLFTRSAVVLLFTNLHLRRW